MAHGLLGHRIGLGIEEGLTADLAQLAALVVECHAEERAIRAQHGEAARTRPIDQAAAGRRDLPRKPSSLHVDNAERGGGCQVEDGDEAIVVRQGGVGYRECVDPALGRKDHLRHRRQRYRVPEREDIRPFPARAARVVGFGDVDLGARPGKDRGCQAEATVDHSEQLSLFEIDECGPLEQGVGDPDPVRTGRCGEGLHPSRRLDGHIAPRKPTHKTQEHASERDHLQMAMWRTKLNRHGAQKNHPEREIVDAPTFMYHFDLSCI